MAAEASGGFVRPSLPSPPASSTAASSTTGALLPKPRSRPLKLGSSKEGALIDYVDAHITLITRKYASASKPKRGGKLDVSSEPDVEEDTEPLTEVDGITSRGFEGYTSFKQAGADIEKLIDLVWVSGTPSLQISYLLTFALLVVTYISSFPPAPKTTFRVLGKLDLAFAQLIQGQDFETGEPLPGFDSGKAVSATQKVRIKSLAERTRVVVVEEMKKGEFEIEDGDAQDEDQADGDDAELDYGFDYDMEIARVYDRTLQILGDALGDRAS